MGHKVLNITALPKIIFYLYIKPFKYQPSQVLRVVRGWLEPVQYVSGKMSNIKYWCGQGVTMYAYMQYY